MQGEIRPLFPAGALVRYVNQGHQPVSIADLKFDQSDDSSITSSTDSGVNILEEPRFKKLTEFINECITDYLDNIVSYKYDSYTIVHAWVNRAAEGNIQPMHLHGNSIISGVYYLQADKSNAPLYFEKIEINTSPYLAISTRKQTLFNANRMAFPAETGICFLFPSNIRHGYDIPNTCGERISLAFNVMLNGLGKFYYL
jgi:uncharacterized protein (TIGR02466 family)